jgi:hypothetical protein
MNFASMTYKKKFRWLLIAIPFLLFISYVLAVKKTVMLFRDCSSMQTKLESINDAPKNIKQIKNEITQIDGMISANDSSGTDFRQLLLEKTGDFCLANNITLKEFPASIHEIKSDYSVETNTVVLEGSFISLLKFTYLLEQKYKIGKVASVDFSAKYNLTEKKNRLTEKIYVQNIKKRKDEK